MRQKILIMLITLLCALVIAGCNSETSFVTKEYVLPEESTSADKQGIDLNQYRIQEGAIISLKGLIDVSDLSMKNVCFFDNNNLLLLYADKNHTRLDTYLFSLRDASIQWYGSVDNLSGAGAAETSYRVINTQPLVIMEDYSKVIWVIRDKKVGLKIDLSEYNCQSVVTNENGVFYTNDKGNDIEYISFSSGEKEKILVDMETYSCSVRNLAYISDDGKHLYVHGVNKFTLEETTFIINIENKEIVAHAPGIYDFWQDDKFLFSKIYEDDGFLVKKRSGENYKEVTAVTLKPQVDFDKCVFAKNRVITEENDGMTYAFSYYNMDTMTRNSSTTMDFGAYFSYEYSTDCEYTYCTIDENFGYNEIRNMLVFEINTDKGHTGVFLWDINTSDTVLENLDVRSYTDDEYLGYINETLYTTLSDEIHKIYKDYGVAIYVGSNTPEEFIDFKALSFDNIYDMTNAVHEVKKALDAYPKGFFDYFTADEYLSGINIYLVGTITPTTQGYINGPAGFTNTCHNFEVIVLDVNYLEDIEGTMYHELCHIIYKRIENDELMDEVDYFDVVKWNSYNPEDFKYYDAYLDPNGQDYSIAGDPEYTGDTYTSDADLKNIYFIDTYSKTFMKEDLARLMEYSMSNPDMEILKSPHIVNKLNYFYSVIRAVWNTKGWPKQTTWEANVYKE